MCWRRSNVRTLFFSLLRGSANPSGPATLPRVWRARSVRQTNNLIAIETHADSQRVLCAHRLDTDNVAGTAPFDGLLAGNFRGHLQKDRSEEHTSELQSLAYLVCRLLLEKK